MESNEQPNSICHVTASQIYQLPHSQYDPPFPLLHGEAILNHGRTAEGLVILTNYRLYLQEDDDNSVIVPTSLIDVVDIKELLEILIWSKNGPTYRIKFASNAFCVEWYNIIMQTINSSKQLEETFAFVHYAYSKESLKEAVLADSNENFVYNKDALMHEVQRLNFIKHGAWRISERNIEYGLCPSYPSHIIVPSYFDDTALDQVAKFRGARRIPTIVWRHQGNGAIIARSSQPEVGLLYWRSKEDEEFLKAITDACNFDRGQHSMVDSLSSHSPTSTDSEGSTQVPLPSREYKKVLIMDARSYSTALANRARGGGCEYEDYYTTCEMKFMNLPNIHTIRNSFKSLRVLCEQSNPANWYSTLESSNWFINMSTLIGAAVTAAEAVHHNAQPVLVHCSDGWDRTPQIVSLAELLLDPYYRTVEGFQVLVEREWLAYGHKFADRCGQSVGSSDTNERCPIFLQWLDCVHQLLVQFPTSFEFSQNFLIKLAHHTYSGMFGTFLCNTRRDRVTRGVDSATFSVWAYLRSPWFRNHLFVEPRNVQHGVSPLWPLCNVRDLHFWSELYLGTLEVKSRERKCGGTCPGSPPVAAVTTITGEEVSPSSPMTRTRSYGDLTNGSDAHLSPNRRKSDPSITVDIITSNLNDLPHQIESDKPATTQHQQQTQGGETLTNTGVIIEDDDEVTLQMQNDDQNCSDDCIFKNDARTPENFEQEPIAHLYIKDSTGRHEDSSVASGATRLIENRHSNGDSLKDSLSRRYELASGVVINKQKTDMKNEKDLVVRIENASSLEEAGDINRLNGNNLGNERLIVVPGADFPTSVETSTETLTSSDNHNKAVVSSSLTKPMITNGFDTNLNLHDGNIDICCKDCFIQSIRVNNGKFISCNSNNNSERNSRYSTPLYSRTPSGNGWENTLNSLNHQHRQSSRYNSIEDDGLQPYRCMVQQRVSQIIEEHQRREEELQREIQSLKEALSKQTRQHCSNEGDRADDANSVVDSVCSAGEGQTSAVESLRSDISWEAVEEGPVNVEGVPTLWVPDHAVSRCTGCQSQFWLGRRKHHCRSCGRIFCSDCSDYSTPLPAEQLYSPVRVCTPCYSKLRRDCGEIPDRCKHIGPHTANTNPRITASSN